MIFFKNDIEKLIPHRAPFLFLDECEIIIPGEHGISKKTFKEDEYFFEGHFPNNPIVPGVIVSYKLRDYKDKSVLFMSVNKAKFRKPVLPNDKVSFEVKIQNKVRDVYKFSGTCLKNNVKVSESEFSAMITYK